MPEHRFFKNKTVLVLNPEAEYPLHLSVPQAELILENICAITEFVEEFGNETVIERFLDRIEAKYYLNEEDENENENSEVNSN